jgi:hypothetical protein
MNMNVFELMMIKNYLDGSSSWVNESVERPSSRLWTKHGLKNYWKEKDDELWVYKLTNYCSLVVIFCLNLIIYYTFTILYTLFCRSLIGRIMEMYVTYNSFFWSLYFYFYFALNIWSNVEKVNCVIYKCIDISSLVLTNGYFYVI